MYLAGYHFTGPTATLIAGYDRMRVSFRPAALVFHACVEQGDGITVYDACPDEATFQAFRTSPDFASALRDAGLPTPTAELLGQVHATVPPV